MKDKGSTSSSWEVLAWLAPIIWIKQLVYQLRLFLAISCVLTSVALDLLSPIIFRSIIDNLVDSLKTGSSQGLIVLLLAYGVCWSGGKVIIQLGELLVFRVMARGIRVFASKVFNHIINLSASFHINRATGAVTEAVFRAQEGIANIFWGLFFSIVPLVIEIIVATGIIGWLFGYVYAAVFISILAAYVLFSYLGIEWFSLAQQRLNRVKMKTGAKIVDSLLNFETVKVFNNTEHEIDRAQNVFQQQEEAFTNFFWRVDLVHAGQGLIIGIGLTVLTFMTGRQVIAGQFSIGDFTMINWYLLQFVTPLTYLGKVLKDVRKGINDTQNTIDILKVESEILDRKGAKDLTVKNPRLEFKSVNFSYESDRTILNDVSFTVEPGQTIALVGMTGSGKSTIARLLYRFYDVDSGSILIDGVDLRDITQSSLQGSIGIVPQDTVLFNDSLFYNIAYGDLDATKERVADAVKRAHLTKLIDSMPEKMHTIVGERGLKLSGGEKQRVAIARVILKQPAIYIFDEATSALDTKTEQAIHANLREISQNCTTVIIAHRLSTVVHADKIIVLEQGRVCESGSHKELIDKGGTYARLYRQQS